MTRLLARAGALGTLLLLAAAGRAGTVAFDPVQVHPLGHVPEPVALGDLDRDGLLDAVNANTAADGSPGGDSVSVLLGRPGGAFERGAHFPAGRRPEGLALARIDGDEHLDAVTANFGESSVSVLPGDGKGGFGPPVVTPVPGGPRFIVAADWNGDAVQDLATANHDGDSVSVLLGGGTGSFLIVETVPAGDGPEVVALGSLNADAHLDLVTADALGNTITPLLNGGTGRFAAGAPHPVGTNPRFVLLEDLDLDGLDDAIVANNDSESVTVEKGLGDGTFRTAATLSYAAPTIQLRKPNYLALADVDSDGALDVLCTWARSDAFSVFPGSAAGPFAFGPLSVHETGLTPVGIAAADLDSDGGPDVVVTDALEDTGRVYRSYRGGPGVIVEAGAPGTASIGPWVPSEAPFAFGRSPLFSKDGTRYEWEAHLPAAGLYEACLWWTVTPSRAPAVPVEVLHEGGASSRLVDQTRGIGLWHSLGTYAFAGRARVTLVAPPGSDSVSADAVRFRPRPAGTPESIAGTLAVEARARPTDIALGGGLVLAFHAALRLEPGPAAGEVVLAAAVFAAAGEGEESTAIASLTLHADSNGSGALDAGDRQLGGALAFGSDIRAVTFLGFEEPLPADRTLDLLVACEIASDVDPAGLQLELATLVARAPGGAPAAVKGLPLRGWVFPREVPPGRQRPSDGNQDGRLDISDAVFVLAYLFQGTVAQLPCGSGAAGDPSNVRILDSNGDGRIDLSDPIRVLGYLFGGAPPPVLGRDCVEAPGCPDNAAKCGA